MNLALVPVYFNWWGCRGWGWGSGGVPDNGESRITGNLRQQWHESKWKLETGKSNTFSIEKIEAFASERNLFYINLFCNVFFLTKIKQSVLSSTATSLKRQILCRYVIVIRNVDTARETGQTNTENIYSFSFFTNASLAWFVSSPAL